MKVTSVGIVLLCVIAKLTVSQREHVHLVDNGYEGLVVTVKPSCQGTFSSHMAQSIVDNIQTYLTEASSALFKATKYRAYIRNVKVILPKDFPAVERISITADSNTTFQKGNIIIDYQSLQYRHRPYVVHPGGCGEPAHHLHLTWEYVANRTLAELYGPVGKTLVHELGHMLWGLMDEYVMFNSLIGQENNEAVNGYACPETLTGRLWREGRSCNVKEDCSFSPMETQQYEAMSTLMGYYFLDQVTEFCDNDPNNPATLHNPRAQSQHNLRCQNFIPGRVDAPSAWEIMRLHDDFSESNNPPINPDSDTQPTFTFIQPTNEVIVLVLDTSGSMDGDKITNLRIAASYLIENAIVDCHKIGIVTFSYNSRVAQQLTIVSDNTTKTTLKQALPTYAGGNTCTGCGIITALQMAPPGGAIVVLTDGADTNADVLQDAHSQALEANVVVDSVLYDRVDASHPLVDLAQRTGGSIVHANADDTSQLYKNFLYLLQKRSCDSSAYSNTVFNDKYNISSSAEQGDVVDIDSTLTGNITFLFSSDVPLSATLLEVYPPNSDTPISQNDYTQQYGQLTKILVVDIAGRIGEWRFTITNQGTWTTQYEVLITASGETRSCASQPITIVPIVQPRFDFSLVRNYPELHIRAMITRGTSPALGLSVSAVITNDHLEEAYKYDLSDNGEAGVDSVANDGVYSARFAHFRGNGIYRIQYKVTGQISQRDSQEVFGWALDLPRLRGDPPPGPPPITDTSSPSSMPENITRSQEGGIFQVTNQPAGTETRDWSPPGTVNDLSIVVVAATQAHLQFTAVGEDYNTGAASSYDIRVTDTNYEDLLSNFNTQPSLLDFDLVNVSEVIDLGGRNAGEIIRIPLNYVPQYYGEVFYYAVQATDSSNNTGGVSNIYEHTYRLQPVTTTTTTPPPTTSTTTTPPPTTSTTTTPPPTTSTTTTPPPTTSTTTTPPPTRATTKHPRMSDGSVVTARAMMYYVIIAIMIATML